MKKSTLITTIAMIVVVVVALSTATYAWFTASATANVTATYTTTAESNWTLTVGTGGASYALTGTSKLTDTIEARSGLWSPSATLAGAMVSTEQNKASTTGVTVNPQILYTANKATDTTATLTAAATSAVAPDKVYKVTNVKDAAHNLALDIYVYVTPGDSTAPYFAMAAYSFSVDYAIVAASGTPTVTTATNGYNIGATASEPTAPASYTNGQTVTKGAPVSAANVVLASSELYKPVYDTAATKPAASGWQTAAAAVTNTGIASGDVYLKYTIAIGSVTSGYCADVSIYSWIDGWLAEEGAANTSFNVEFVFRTND